MGEKKNKFNALTPEVLGENKQKQIYTDALDFAFSNSDIKNIAITGIYGAGKSTVWNTYVHEKELNNVITVSLGKYKDDNSENPDNTGNDNRVERQLINQILSQIQSRKIPLSKYGFKSNKSVLNVFFQSVALLSVISSVIFWITKDTIISFIKEVYENFNGVSLIILCTLLFFVPLIYYFLIFHRGNKLRISKITFKGAEANVNDADISDESVLDRDIKELVYLLRSSGSKIVVFEDLDRYDNASIYTKLRELNFLLNKYIKVNDEKETPVRFIYMLKDSLFFSKNRTKFFDFILPIVPVVDSKTSENELIELLKGIDNAPDRSLLADISLYVDDMRLLKNIVNEYIVYSKIIPLGQIDLENNKLFALITLKNIFPNEFDLLQEDKGFIREVFDKLESDKKKVVSNLNQKLEKINENMRFINNRIENDKFKAMALMISADIRPYSNQYKTMTQFLKDWSQNPDNSIDIKYPSGSQYFTYNDFLDRYVLTDDEKKALVEKLPEDFSIEMNKLNLDREKIKKQIKDIEIYSYKELISKMTTDQRDELFSIGEFDIVKSHYFPLIRFLIVDGLLDETYWYYKGNFNVNASNTLKRNDTIYIKGLKEGKYLDIFLDVETPNEIIRRLNKADFSRDNILNKKILKTCLAKNNIEYIMAISESVDANDKYEDLVKILDEFELSTIRSFIDILLKNSINIIVNILESCGDENVSTFKNILISVLISGSIDKNSLEVFRIYIEQNENIISSIPEEEFEVFINNISSANIMFGDLSEANCDKDRLLKIENIQAYKISVKNILFVSGTLLDKKIYYGSLLEEIYQSDFLYASRDYIENNFASFISEYIDECQNDVSFTNNENILVKILQSDISEGYKLEYLGKNNTEILNFSVLKDNEITTKILNCLLSGDKIKFCSENISVYWDMIETYGREFIEYIERNLNENNFENILSNNLYICNTFVNDSQVSDRVFAFVINYADTPINDIDSKLKQHRVNTLVSYELIEVNEQNIETLLTNSYNEELTLLANNDDKDKEDSVISILLKHELPNDLIYTLVNSKLSDENSLKLIKSLEDSVLIERINQDKEAIIKDIINRKLSKENIDYICELFNTFELKNEFIEALDTRGELEELDNTNLNDSFMKYVLTLPSIQVSTKISLIVIKIRNKIEKKSLKEYISLTKEIADLANVWNSNYPLLDNGYKKEIGEALIKAGYVKLRKEKDSQRIMPVKKQKNTTLETHML